MEEDTDGEVSAQSPGMDSAAAQTLGEVGSSNAVSIEESDQIKDSDGTKETTTNVLGADEVTRNELTVKSTANELCYEEKNSPTSNETESESVDPKNLENSTGSLLSISVETVVSKSITNDGKQTDDADRINRISTCEEVTDVDDREQGQLIIDSPPLSAGEGSNATDKHSESSSGGQSNHTVSTSESSSARGSRNGTESHCPSACANDSNEAVAKSQQDSIATANNAGTPSNNNASPATAAQRISPSPSTPARKRRGTRAAQDAMLLPEDLEHLRKPFKYGWKRELVYRNATDSGGNRMCDVYYFPPKGRKLRSMVEIGTFLSKDKDSPVNLTNFTFRKLVMFGPPDEVVRSAGQPKNRPVEGAVKKTPAPSKPPSMLKKALLQRMPVSQVKTPAGIKITPTGIRHGRIISKHVKTPVSAARDAVKAAMRNMVLARSNSNSEGEAVMISSTTSTSGDSTTVTTGLQNVIISARPSGGHVRVLSGRPRIRHRSPNWEPSDSSAYSDSDEGGNKASEHRDVEIIKEGVSAGDPTQNDEEDDVSRVLGTPSALISSIVNPQPQKRPPSTDSTSLASQVSGAGKIRIISARNPSVVSPVTSIQGTRVMFVNEEGKRVGRRTCSVTCRLMPGVKPSLECHSCHTLFHHKCVGMYNSSWMKDNFVCATCKLVSNTVLHIRPPGPTVVTSALRSLLTPSGQPLPSSYRPESQAAVPSVDSLNATSPACPILLTIPPPPPLASRPQFLKTNVQNISHRAPALPFLLPKGQPVMPPPPPLLVASPGLIAQPHPSALTGHIPVVSLPPALKPSPSIRPPLRFRPFQGQSVQINSAGKTHVEHSETVKVDGTKDGEDTSPAPVTTVRVSSPSVSMDDSLPVSFRAQGMEESDSDSSEDISPPAGNIPIVRTQKIVKTGVIAKLTTTTVVTPSESGHGTNSISSSSGMVCEASADVSTSQCTTLHLLTLPKSVASNVDLSQTLKLSINDADLFVSPERIISEKEHVKLLLPPGAAPVLADKTSHFGVFVSNVPPPVDSTAPCHLPRQTPTRYLQSFRMLQSSYEIMMNIYSHLSTAQLLRVRIVCKLWNTMAMQPCLWKRVRLQNVLITDWESACRFFIRAGVKKLSLQGFSFPNGEFPDQSNSPTWEAIKRNLPLVKNLEELLFGCVPPEVLHSMTEKMPNLLNISADSICDTSVSGVYSVPNTGQAVEMMMKAVHAVEHCAMSCRTAAMLFKVSETDLLHMVKKEEVRLTEEEEKTLLLYLMRLSGMGFCVSLKLLRIACKEILSRRNSTAVLPEVSSSYTSELFQRSQHFFHNSYSAASLHAQVKSHFAKLQELYRDMDISFKPENMLFFSTINIEMPTSEGDSSSMVTAMATMTRSDLSLPVMLVWSDPHHPPSDSSNLVMASAEASQPTPALVFRYLQLVISRMKERPLLLVFGGHSPALSEKLVSFCASENVTFYCVPQDAARYVFPPLLGGPLFLLKEELESVSLTLTPERFISRLKHQMWSPASVRKYSIMRAFTVTGFYPVNPKALKKYQEVGKLSASRDEDMDDEGENGSDVDSIQSVSSGSVHSDAEMISDQEEQDTAKQEDTESSKEGPPSAASALPEESNKESQHSTVDSEKERDSVISVPYGEPSGKEKIDSCVDKDSVVGEILSGGEKTEGEVHSKQEMSKVVNELSEERKEVVEKPPAADLSSDDDLSDAGMVIDESADENGNISAESEDEDEKEGSKHGVKSNKGKLVVQIFRPNLLQRKGPTKTMDSAMIERVENTINSVVTASREMYDLKSVLKVKRNDLQKVAIKGNSVSEKELDSYSATINEVAKAEESAEEAKELSHQHNRRSMEEEEAEEELEESDDESLEKSIDAEMDDSNDKDVGGDGSVHTDENDEAEVSEKPEESEDAPSEDEDSTEKRKRKKRKKSRKKKRKSHSQKSESEKYQNDTDDIVHESPGITHSEKKKKKKKKKKRSKNEKKTSVSENIDADVPTDSVPQDATALDTLAEVCDTVPVEHKEAEADMEVKEDLLEEPKIHLVDHDYARLPGMSFVNAAETSSIKLNEDGGCSEEIQGVETRDSTQKEYMGTGSEEVENSLVEKEESEQRPVEDVSNSEDHIEKESGDEDDNKETEASSVDSSSSSSSSSDSSSDSSRSSSDEASSHSDNDSDDDSGSEKEGSSSPSAKRDKGDDLKSGSDVKRRASESPVSAEESSDEEESDSGEEVGEEEESEEEKDGSSDSNGGNGEDVAEEEDDEEGDEDDDSKCQLCMRTSPPHSKDMIIDWVDCDGNCGRWFHVICILRSKAKANPKHYVCPSCRCKR
ncbi:uncharacterized protein LOC101864548 [Aplysia californica]|uniref:Uncharacterized protein LOC101864548 n=1 Tax=Aplysia californica TaxID=6500 RepID=A0ABM1A8T1_APLCA|nr:uncharacterized protein LOC101864548 [Aplysia californica]XP_012943024.1 uncharacterized protein LOC101864548 [Aplysia californica]